MVLQQVQQTGLLCDFQTRCFHTYYNLNNTVIKYLYTKTFLFR